jgi:TrmH family RNA methyltransferase
MSSPIPLSSNKLKQIRRLKQKKYRAQTNCFLCEGFRLFDAALKIKKIIIQEIVLGENFLNTKKGILVKQVAKKKDIDIYTTDDVHLKKISDEVTPSGIIFIVEKDQKSPSSLTNIQESILLYLDRISEPGNLGSILRSACWFGVTSILLSPECVDPWNSKSVRASAGTVFEADIYTNIEFDHIKKIFKQKGYQFIATVVSGGVSLDRWEQPEKSIIFIGQEASGLSKEIVKHADGHINIPGYGIIESLNISVATGIILYEAKKPKLKKQKMKGS